MSWKTAYRSFYYAQAPEPADHGLGCLREPPAVRARLVGMVE